MGNGSGLVLRRVLHHRNDNTPDEERYKWQSDIRANYILVDDVNPAVPVGSVKPSTPILQSSIKWPNRGELIAGSFMCNVVDNAPSVGYEDVDIYFKGRDEVVNFLNMNPRMAQTSSIATAKVAIRAVLHGPPGVSNQECNLIFGVDYSSPADLITRFDIRACSIALDPGSNTVHYVVGAADDVIMQRIVYNPVPHNTTVARLVKYTKKGFEIDPYQRVFLAELLSSDNYNPELEISTGYRGTQDDEI